MIERAFRLNDHGTLDITNIFQKATVEGPPPFNVDMTVLAKVKFDFLEIGEVTIFTFRLENPETGDTLDVEFPYTFPPLEAWLRAAGCYINLNLADVGFATAGEHLASVWHDGKPLASESFTITNELE